MSYQHIDTNKSHLVLPDGQRADSLRVGQLYRVLTKIGVPGIAASMGKDDLLAAYEAALSAQAESLRRSGAGFQSSAAVSEYEMRLAAEAMIEGAR